MTDSEKLISKLKKILNIEGTIETKELIQKAIKEFPEKTKNEKTFVDYLNGDIETFDGSEIEVCDRAFYNNTTIKKVILSNVPNYVCSKATGLEEIVILDGVKEIGEQAFSYSTANKIYIPDSVEIIRKTAFGQLTNFVIDKLPKNLKTIELGAFSLSSISFTHIPSGVSSITGLTTPHFVMDSLTFDGNIENIAASAFYIPRYQTYPSKFVFSSNTEVPTISSNSFANISWYDYNIYVPDDLYDEWIAAQNWTNYASIIKKLSELE